LFSGSGWVVELDVEDDVLEELEDDELELDELEDGELELDELELDELDEEPGLVVVVVDASSHVSVFGSHFGSDPDASGTSVSMAATSAMTVTRPTSARPRARTVSPMKLPPNLAPWERTRAS
jgi:hypothetical protein